MNCEKRVLLIVPAYNEEDSIQAVVERITAFQPNGYTLDYLIVNDGSVDGTDEICRTCGFHYVSLVQNLGIGGAVQCGYRYALEQGYDVAVQFDGDGQHDITYLDGLVAPIFDGSADFTIGSRFPFHGPAPGGYPVPVGADPRAVPGDHHGPDFRLSRRIPYHLEAAGQQLPHRLPGTGIAGDHAVLRRAGAGGSGEYV